MALSSRFWVVIPAAGTARRMQSSVPKQYLVLRGRSVIEWSVAPFLARSDCAGVVVVLAADDRRWSALALSNDLRVNTALGGAERSVSVRQGLASLRGRAEPDDWILVHDAARPCLSHSDLDRLIDTVRGHAVGGLLAAPVIDTLKKSGSDGCVESTVDRAELWRALTPQMFRCELLEKALAHASNQSTMITDESQAVELLGLRPLLVAGSADNLKITVPEDLRRAEHILALAVGNDVRRTEGS